MPCVLASRLPLTLTCESPPLTLACLLSSLSLTCTSTSTPPPVCTCSHARHAFTSFCTLTYISPLSSPVTHISASISILVYWLPGAGCQRLAAAHPRGGLVPRPSPSRGGRSAPEKGRRLSCPRKRTVARTVYPDGHARCASIKEKKLNEKGRESGDRKTMDKRGALKNADRRRQWLQESLLQRGGGCRNVGGKREGSTYD